MPIIKIVESAFIVGVIPNLSIEYICIGKVSEFVPVTKLVITKSSNDNVNDIKNADIIPGIIVGIITLVNA